MQPSLSAQSIPDSEITSSQNKLNKMFNKMNIKSSEPTSQAHELTASPPMRQSKHSKQVKNI